MEPEHPRLSVTRPPDTIFTQEVDHLADEDLLGEADVYWTYGKWHDAMQIYEWWIGNHGTGSGNDVALQAAASQAAAPFGVKPSQAAAPFGVKPSQAAAPFGVKPSQAAAPFGVKPSQAAALQGANPLQAAALQATARKYLDCAAKAMDFEAFCRMMRRLIDQGVDQGFLQDMAVFGLMRDPGNFELIGIAEAVDVEESRIVSIAQKVVDAEKTPGQRKAELWKRNRNDAGRIASGKAAATGHSVDLQPIDHLMLVRATSGKDYDDGTVTRQEAEIFGTLCGADYLDDTAAVVDHWKTESVMAHLRREMECRPMRLTVYVDYLRIAHGEGLREEYATALLAIFSVLLSANAGSGLRRRLLAAGRLLGQHGIFDFLSGSQGREFMAVARKVRDTPSVYVPEQAWAKSAEWMRPLVLEKECADA